LITCAASVLKVYSVKTGEVVKTLRHKSRVTGFFFNPANALQVPSCFPPKQLQATVWRLCCCRLVEPPLNTFGGGPQLYSAAEEGIIRLWDFEDGVLLKVRCRLTWRSLASC
jgi:hypothetical protein